MISILFNYDGNITELQEQEFIKTTFKTVVDEEGVETQVQVDTNFSLVFTLISEMVDGCYMAYIEDVDDFEFVESYLDANGKYEVIGKFDKEGKQKEGKDTTDKYTKTKYLKWLKDKYTYDADGNKLDKLPKEVWQCNNYMGWKDRDLEDV